MLREAAQHGPLQSLTPEQVRYGAVPLTTVPDRTVVWGLAWLRFGDADVRATVQIRRWTDNAVDVVVDVDGQEQRVWIWRSACDPLKNRQDAWS
ncbi:hypothetical protein [Microbacterium rhizosphaerae]|uniref:hypothetical protein n=1 Tax=Microbacterium rhizosphaerae TaxID=1678237 RepID=UPI0031E73614